MAYATFQRDHLADVESYANDVLEGKRPANRFEKLAVERESRDLKLQERDEFKYYFDPDESVKVIQFIETFPHVKGTSKNCFRAL
ncbi:MAG: hypothetical protein OXE99_04870 [Cellvibrionales bacterium]|nr:hypothetical protein [Cellvibrionales bacterium]